MDGDKFSLFWENFERDASKRNRKLLDDTNFTDVTLACDEGRFETHKVILSSSSPAFEKILVGNPNQHPLIYLRKVKYSCLKSLIQFLYLGQTEIDQTELQDFINLGKDLEIEGLNQDHHDETTKISSEETQSNPDSSLEKSEEIRNEDESKNSSDKVEIKPELVQETVILKDNPTVKNDGNGLACDECGKSFSQAAYVYQHKKSAHMGVSYPCSQCGYKATTKSNLNRHRAGKRSKCSLSPESGLSSFPKSSTVVEEVNGRNIF